MARSVIVSTLSRAEHEPVVRVGRSVLLYKVSATSALQLMTSVESL